MRPTKTRSGRVAQLRLSASSDAMASDRAIAAASAPATAPVFLSPDDSRTPTRTAAAGAYFPAAGAAALTVVRNGRSFKPLTAIAGISYIKTAATAQLLLLLTLLL